MLTAAFALLGAAVLLGSGLAVLHLLPERRAVPTPLSALHGGLAICGFVVLVFALHGPPRGVEAGAGAFGHVAAVLAALALLAGGGVLAARLRKKRFTGMLLGIHATLAISAFVILTAYLFA